MNKFNGKERKESELLSGKVDFDCERSELQHITSAALGNGVGAFIYILE